MSTLAEKRHMGRVASLGCVLCLHVLGIEDTPAEVHHPRRGTGGGQKAPDYETIPLCPRHHRGNEGIHGLGSWGFQDKYGVSEYDLLLVTYCHLGLAQRVPDDMHDEQFTYMTDQEGGRWAIKRLA